MANVYEQKLRKLYNQIGVMLQEANSVEISADGMDENDPIAARIARRCEQLYNAFKISAFDPDVVLDKPEAKKMVMEITRAIAGTQIDFAKGQAINAKNYNDFKTAYKAIQTISQSNIWNDVEKQELSRNTSVLKKGYITVGVGMILVSVIAVLLAGKGLDIISDFRNIAQMVKDVKELAKLIGKLLVLGLLAVPAVLGLVMIICASRDFNDSGYLEKVMGFCYPIVKLAHPLFDKIIESGKTAIQARIMSMKKDFNLR